MWHHGVRNTFTEAYNATSRLRDEAANRGDIESFNKLDERLRKVNADRSRCGLKGAGDAVDFITKIINKPKMY